MKEKYTKDTAVQIGAVISTLFLGGTAYAVALMLIEALADKLSALLNAVIAIL